jgi:hypothetical protein
VNALHLAWNEAGRESMQELCDLLTSASCTLALLDLSYTAADGFLLSNALKTNRSLTSLDVRKVPMMRDFYKPIGETLLAPGATCRLGFVRCDAFEVLEGETALSLREKSLEPGAAKLLVGVLKHNPTLVDIDLTATDLETEAANDLAAILEFRRLSALQLQFNPDLSAECRAALKAAAERWQPEMRLSL